MGNPYSQDRVGADLPGLTTAVTNPVAARLTTIKKERRGSVATIVSMPKWGLAMKTGLIVEWLKHPGDAVQQGEPHVEIESEKATNEVDGPATGMLRWLEVAQGENAPVGAALAVIVAPGEDLSDEQVAALIREDAEIKRQKA